MLHRVALYRPLRGGVPIGDTRYMRRLLIATTNPGKVREFRRLLDGCGFELVTPADLGLRVEVEENGDSYAQNASLKARAFSRAARCLALADDSGLEVDALDGEPGIYSARYGGPGLNDRGRVRLLLRNMAGIAEKDRTARYRAVVAVAEPDGTTRCFEGVQEGRIAGGERGENGFGYDPVFVCDDGRTVAELNDDEKDAISHRGMAVRAAAACLCGAGAG